MNVLILTDNNSMRKDILKALDNILSNLYEVKTKDYICIVPSNVCIYTNDCRSLSYITDKDLIDKPTINLPDGDIGYILGEIDSNIETIKNYCNDIDFDIIINAFNPYDKGDALFEYINSIIHFDKNKVSRVNIIDLNPNIIANNYLKIITNFKNI